MTVPYYGLMCTPQTVHEQAHSFVLDVVLDSSARGFSLLQTA